jgi:hypothetical protein
MGPGRTRGRNATGIRDSIARSRSPDSRASSASLASVGESSAACCNVTGWSLRGKRHEGTGLDVHFIITDAWLAKSRAIHLSGTKLLLALLGLSLRADAVGGRPVPLGVPEGRARGLAGVRRPRPAGHQGRVRAARPLPAREHRRHGAQGRRDAGQVDAARSPGRARVRAGGRQSRRAQGAAGPRRRAGRRPAAQRRGTAAGPGRPGPASPNTAATCSRWSSRACSTRRSAP